MLCRHARSLTASLPWQVRAASSFTSLPMIDISSLVDQSASWDDKLEAGRQLDAACREVGFFYVQGHGMSPELQEGVLAQARRWFALPDSVKESIALSPASHYRGWQRLGANVTRYDGGFQRDWHEAIDLYKEVQPSDIKAHARLPRMQEGGALPPSPIHGVNLWPDQVPEFAAALRQYVDGCLGIGAAILRGIALGLQLPGDFFEGGRAGREGSYWVTRAIYYPPLSQGSQQAAGQAAAAAAALGGTEVKPSTQLSCGEHTDYGLLTLVNQEVHMGALQVKNAAGKWFTAAPLPGSFVCNVGDMFKVLTNGRYEPTVHRVINSDAQQSRVSIPFFYEPCYEAIIQPLPQFCRDRAPQFQPILYGTHLESKVLSNFEL